MDKLNISSLELQKIFRLWDEISVGEPGFVDNENFSDIEQRVTNEVYTFVHLLAKIRGE